MKITRTALVLTMVATAGASAQTVSSVRALDALAASGEARLLPITVPLGSTPRSFGAGDLNSDGLMDFVVSTNSGLMVVESDGHRSYGPPTVFAGLIFNLFTDPLVADFDGDGDLDIAGLASAGFGSETFEITVLTNAGDGSFTVGAPLGVIHSPVPGSIFQALGWTAADMDGDGLTDFEVATTIGGQANGDGYHSIVLNRTLPGGPITLADSVSLITGDGSSFVIVHGDLDNDGDEDLVTSQAKDHSIAVLLNDGSGIAGTMDSTTLSGSTGFGNRGLAVGDLNADGFADIAFLDPWGSGISTNTVTVLLNLDGGTDSAKAGQFREDVAWAIGPQPPTGIATRIAIGDFDRDGFNDLVSSFVGNVPGTGELSVLRASGPTETLAPGFGHQSMIVMDLEGDGDLDFASFDVFRQVLLITVNTGF